MGDHADDAINAAIDDEYRGSSLRSIEDLLDDQECFPPCRLLAVTAHCPLIERDTMSDDKQVFKITTGRFRLSFPSLDKPTAMKGSQAEPKYSIKMLFAKNDPNLKALKDLANAAVLAKWGERPKGLKHPFCDGDEKDYDGYAGMLHILANSKNKPRVVGAIPENGSFPEIDPAEAYAGCYCRASVNAYCTDSQEWGKRVSFGLLSVQKLDEGEPFGGTRSDPDEDFADAAAGAKAQAAKANTAPTRTTAESPAKPAAPAATEDDGFGSGGGSEPNF